MKITSLLFSLFIFTQLSWGSEDLFLFFNDHKLGSKSPSGDEGFSELPHVKIFGHQFSAYQELNSDKSVEKVALYLASSSTDALKLSVEDIFNQIKQSIVLQTGEAQVIDVPNFQDASERATTLFAWKNDESILILKKIQSPSRTEIQIQHSDLDYYTSNLGADTGDYLLPKLESSSGQLSITRSAQRDSISINEQRGSSLWPIILGGIAILVFIILITRFCVSKQSA